MAAGVCKNGLAGMLHPKGCKMPCRDQLWNRGRLFHCWVKIRGFGGNSMDHRVTEAASEGEIEAFLRATGCWDQGRASLQKEPKVTETAVILWGSSGHHCKQEVKDSVSVMEVSSVTNREEVHGQRADLVEETGRRVSQLPWICWAEWTNKKQDWRYLS